MADYELKNVGNVSVNGINTIKSSLDTYEHKELQKPAYVVNKVSNQKDVTIDLRPFLEDSNSNNKYFTNYNSDETNNDKGSE